MENPESWRNLLNNWKKGLMGISFFCFAILNSGCASMFVFSPEGAAVEAAKGNDPGRQIIQESIEFLQVEEFHGSVFIILNFQLITDSIIHKCEHTYQVKRNFFGWTHNGGGSCLSVDGLVESDEPVRFGKGGHGIGGDDPITYIAGYVQEPEITKIEVVWEDNQTQKKEVENDSFLSIRKGDKDWVYITGHDTNHDILYYMENPSQALTNDA